MNDDGKAHAVSSSREDAGGPPRAAVPSTAPPVPPGSRHRGRRFHPAVLALRYLAVLVIAVLGVVLLGVSHTTACPLSAGSRTGAPYAAPICASDPFAASVHFEDKSPGAISMEQRFYLLLGLLALATAGTLAWLTGPARRWLVLAAVALLPALIMVVRLPRTPAFYGDSPSAVARGYAIAFLVLAGLLGGFCYPISRLLRRGPRSKADAF